MAKYEVIERFREVKHGGHIYKAGDPYPAPGKKLTKKRVEQLLSDDNNEGRPFLKEVDEGKE